MLEKDADVRRFPCLRKMTTIELTMKTEIAKFWETKAFSDVQIYCGLDGAVVQSHRLILSALSPVIHHALLSVPFQGLSTTLMLPDVDSNQLKLLLSSICLASDEEAIVPEELDYLRFGGERFPKVKEEIELKREEQPVGLLTQSPTGRSGHFRLKQKGDVKKPKKGRGRHKTSLIWNYFTAGDSGRIASCNLCGENVAYNRSTLAMQRHLEKMHQTLHDEFVSLNGKVAAETAVAPKGNNGGGGSSSNSKTSSIWRFYDNAGCDKAGKEEEALARCKICNVFFNYLKESTSCLLRHLKRHHVECYEVLKRDKSLRRSSWMLNDPRHPIWKRFVKSDSGRLATCLDCKQRVDVDELLVVAMAEHLKTEHSVTFQVYCTEVESYAVPHPAQIAKKKPPTPSTVSVAKYFVSVDGDPSVKNCTICRTAVPTNQLGMLNLTRHLTQHHQRRFKSEAGKNKAVTKRKDGKKSKRMVVDDPAERTCPECQKLFSCRPAMRFHRRVVHSGIRPYKCNECGMTFARPDSFRSHTHNSARTFLCSVCGKTFGHRSIRDKHEKAHEGEKRYKCNYCPKKFSTNQMMGNHERTHTGEKPHQCPECGRRFVQKQHLTTHLRIHTGEKPYQCNQCGHTFRHLSSRRNHKCEGTSAAVTNDASE